ncbi:hypothetical protein TRIUR3_22429 [Triticum urartu]|uniref:Uncharacterized protein n=1 Tax=Triticum urartu TaxID=4572 RepID=M7Z982_TRIUA|nr:hypothetical protein TRIUR3_22429 [Triticum urartu]
MTTRTGSPPLPLAHAILAAATTHASRFRRAPAPRSTPLSSPSFALPSPLARFSAPSVYRLLATPPPWLGFRVGLRRCISGGPSGSHGTSWHVEASPNLHQGGMRLIPDIGLGGGVGRATADLVALVIMEISGPGAATPVGMAVAHSAGSA